MNRILWHRIQIGAALLAAFATGVGVTYSYFIHRLTMTEEMQTIKSQQLSAPMVVSAPESLPHPTTHTASIDPLIGYPKLPDAALTMIKARMDAQRCDTDTGRGCVWVNTATGVYYSSMPSHDKDAPRDGFRMTSAPEADAEGYTRAADRADR